MNYRCQGGKRDNLGRLAQVQSHLSDYLNQPERVMYSISSEESKELIENYRREIKGRITGLHIN